jgi:hypothetical protein
MVVRIAADLKEFKANLLDGRAQIEALGTSVAKLSGTWKAHSTKLVQDANNITAAIDKIGAGTLTAADSAKNLRVLDAAMEHLHATGRPVPALMQETADKLRGAVTPAATASTSALAGLAGQLTGMFTVGALIAFGREVLSTGDRIQKMADQTEMSTVEVQKLMYIAGQSGTSIGLLVGAVQNLQQRIGDEGSGAAGALKKLNINFDDFRKLGAYNQMVLAADGVRAIKDPTDRAEVAAALFGRTWKEILPAIKSGMKDVGDQAITMSDDTTKALDKTGDALLRAKGGAVAYAGSIIGLIFKIQDLTGGVVSLEAPMGNSKVLADKLVASMFDLANKIGDDGVSGAMGKLKPVAKDVGAGIADITLKGTALAAVYDDLKVKQEESIERNKREAETQKQIAAAMSTHWNAVGTVIDRVYGVESIAKATQWQDAIESMGGSLERLSNKDLADLEAAMAAGIAALVRSGQATSEQTSAFISLQIQANNTRLATLGVVDVLASETKALLQSADTAEIVAARKLAASIRAVGGYYAEVDAAMALAAAESGGLLAVVGQRPPSLTDPGFSTGGFSGGGLHPLTGLHPASGWSQLSATQSRDAGGPVSAGQPYYIGKGAQPELFVPSRAGTMYPAGSGGTTINLGGITVNGSVLANKDQLGAAIGDALLARLRGQGVRFGVGV